VKVGLFLSAQAAAGESAAARFRTLQHQVRLAEELGFHSVFLGHHYLTSSQFFQPVSLAGHLAAITERVRLGFGVLLSPLLHPLALAEELATLDVISGGRLTVGVGAGYREVEFDAFGIPYGSRRQRMFEGIELMQALWAGERVSYDGRFGTVEGARVTMRPIQPGGPPVWVGAFGPKAIGSAAALGLPWLASPEGTLEVLDERYAAYRRGLADAGHSLDLDYPMSREAAVAPSAAEAADAVRPFLEQQYRGYKQWDQVRDLAIDDVIAEHALVGTPDTVTARLRQYADRLGVTEVILRVDWLGMDPAVAERTIRLVGTEVVPAVRDA
jgi:alkanesulfonate monooxygenase SsuD/methylene tetrahydromethanopterin reductase-like flavin-dependent oxidoreductase (luciferase family)